MLISRTESKLQAVASDLESRFGVQTKVIPADFVAANEGTWDAISAVVSSVPVGLLVNSAGVSYDHAGQLMRFAFCIRVQVWASMNASCMIDVILALQDPCQNDIILLDCADYFDTVSQEDIDNLIKVNVVGTTRVHITSPALL